jgi:3-oxoadipate enol-lactonase
MGGWSAIEVALSHPARVSGIVLSATSGTIDPRRLMQREPGAFDAWQRAAQTALADCRRDNIHPACGARMAREQPGLHLLYQSIDALSAGLDKESLRAHLQATRRRAPEEMSGIDAPVLVITGEEDIVFPAPATDALVASFRQAQGLRLKDTGHSPYFERAAIFNAALEPFLATHAR